MFLFASCQKEAADGVEGPKTGGKPGRGWPDAVHTQPVVAKDDHKLGIEVDYGPEGALTNFTAKRTSPPNIDENIVPVSAPAISRAGFLRVLCA